MDPLSLALGIGNKVIDRLWPDKMQADLAKLELLKLQQSGELSQLAGQLEINKVEAASPNFWVSGWRPFVGWVCGLGCAWNWIGLPAASFVMAAIGHKVEIYPADLGEMMPLLLGMLGIGSLRTLEKIKGVAS